MFKICKGKDAVGDVDDNELELRPMELTVRRILNASQGRIQPKICPVLRVWLNN